MPPQDDEIALPDGTLEAGLALVGPAAERCTTIADLLRQWMASGRPAVVLSVGPDVGLCDAAAAAARAADATILILDPDAPASLTHALDPFRGLDADALLRLAAAASPALAAGTAEAARARALVLATAEAAYAMHRSGTYDLSVANLVDEFHFRRIVDLANPEAFPALGEARARTRRYLRSLPGYDEARSYRQVPMVLEAHAPAQALAEGALAWLARPRYAAIGAASGASATLSDIGAPGLSAMLRVDVRPGEEEAAPFLAACLLEALRGRDPAETILLVVDGISHLPAWQVEAFSSLAGPGCHLLLGMRELRGRALKAAREMRSRLLLPGCGPAGARPLDDSARVSQAMEAAQGGRKAMTHPGGTLIPTRRTARPPRRGPVSPRSVAPTGPGADDAAARDVAERLLAGHGIPAVDAIPDAGVIGTVAAAFVRRREDGLEAGARGAVSAVAGLP